VFGAVDDIVEKDVHQNHTNRSTSSRILGPKWIWQTKRSELYLIVRVSLCDGVTVLRVKTCHDEIFILAIIDSYNCTKINV
jgi:hypothetical protein